MDIYERLEEVKYTEGLSFADVLKLGLELIEPVSKKDAAAMRRSRDAGYRAGYGAAKKEYGITYPCSVCGKLINLLSDNAKEAAEKYMQEHGWGHTECHEKT